MRRTDGAERVKVPRRGGVPGSGSAGEEVVGGVPGTVGKDRLVTRKIRGTKATLTLTRAGDPRTKIRLEGTLSPP